MWGGRTPSAIVLCRSTHHAHPGSAPLGCTAGSVPLPSLPCLSLPFYTPQAVPECAILHTSGKFTADCGVTPGLQTHGETYQPSQTHQPSQTPAEPSQTPRASVTRQPRMSVPPIPALHERLDAMRDSLATARAQSASLGSHVQHVSRLVDEAASRHDAWDARLVHMLESDTRRSAEVARRQEALAAALGIGPRGAGNPMWRGLQHVALFVGLVLSFAFVGPFEALWQWGRRKRRERAARAASTGRGVGRAPGRTPAEVSLRRPVSPAGTQSSSSSSHGRSGARLDKSSGTAVGGGRKEGEGGYGREVRGGGREQKRVQTNGVVGGVEGGEHRASGGTADGTVPDENYVSAVSEAGKVPGGWGQPLEVREESGRGSAHVGNRARRRRSRSEWRSKEASDPGSPAEARPENAGGSRGEVRDYEGERLGTAKRRPSWADGDTFARLPDAEYVQETSEDFWETFE